MPKRRPVLKAIEQRESFQISEAVEAWLEACKERGLRPGTLKRSYPQATRGILLSWCNAHGIKTVGQLDRATLGRLAIDLNERQISKWTVAHYLRTINQFIGWLGRGEDRPPLPRLPRLARDLLSRHEAARLEGAANNIRDQLIIRILWETGCREGELVNLCLPDVSEKGRKAFLRFSGKTGTRRTGISPELHHRLRLYIIQTRPRTTSDRIFIGRRRDRRTRQLEPLTENGVYQVVKDAADAAGFERPIYPHLVRASALTRMQTGPRTVHPALISRATGVSVQVLTQHYSHPTDDALHDALMANLAEPDE